MKSLILLLTILFFVACQNQAPESTENETKIATEVVDNQKIKIEIPEQKEIETTEGSEESAFNATNSFDKMKGIYTGMFEAEKFDESKLPTWVNKINVTIDEIEGKKIKGHSIVAGNVRPFEGTIESQKTGFYEVHAKEPGDNYYDGVFIFTINKNGQEIQGLWRANNEKLAVTERAYILKKVEWKYDPSLTLEGLNYTELYEPYNDYNDEREFLTKDVEKKNPSAELLTKADIENLHKGDLEVMRNSIYARHGYSFKNRKMRYVFNFVDWYVPMSTDIRNQLTELELKNIELLKRYEQHAERYYDSFGR